MYAKIDILIITNVLIYEYIRFERHVNIDIVSTVKRQSNLHNAWDFIGKNV